MYAYYEVRDATNQISDIQWISDKDVAEFNRYRSKYHFPLWQKTTLTPDEIEMMKERLAVPEPPTRNSQPQPHTRTTLALVSLITGALLGCAIGYLCSGSSGGMLGGTIGTLFGAFAGVTLNQDR